jgi:putative transposase
MCWLSLLADLLHFLVLGLRSKTSLAAENLFLRKQIAFYQERKIKPRRLDNPTRLALVRLSRWFDWRNALTVVTPRTFIGWHRKGFELYWRRICQSGRPRIPLDLQQLIRRMRCRFSQTFPAELTKFTKNECGSAKYLVLPTTS